jgi:bifunctional DNase/RNase
MTHDLFKNSMDSFDIDLKEVIINNIVDGVFFSNLVMIQNGVEKEIDSRTSDALAMAVRFGCPIYTYEFILEQAGIVLEEEAEKEVQKARTKRQHSTKEKSIEDFNLMELEELLDQALEEEDYEKAAKIRDEIKKRKEGPKN